MSMSWSIKLGLEKLRCLSNGEWLKDGGRLVLSLSVLNLIGPFLVSIKSVTSDVTFSLFRLQYILIMTSFVSAECMSDNISRWVIFNILWSTWFFRDHNNRDFRNALHHVLIWNRSPYQIFAKCRKTMVLSHNEDF